MSNKQEAKVLGNRSRGLAFILSAPAGTGKTTLVAMLEREFDSIINSVSYTTRAPRKGEREGTDYSFISQEDFQKKIEQNEFLEYACVFAKYYGTSRIWVEDQLRQGKHVFLVIDTQGARKLMDIKFPAISIFVHPPSMEELSRRLVKRETESAEDAKKRLAQAEREIAEAKYYDYEIINCNLNIAYEVLRSIVIAEAHKLTNKF